MNHGRAPEEISLVATVRTPVLYTIDERGKRKRYGQSVRWGTSDDRGVAPVIGIILIVAIAVILSAIIGKYIFGLDILQSQTAGPQVSFETEYDENNLTLRHASGSEIEHVRERLTFAVSNNDGLTFDAGSDEDFSGVTGDHMTSSEEIVLSDIHAAATVRVIWTDPNTGDALVIFKWDGEP